MKTSSGFGLIILQRRWFWWAIFWFAGSGLAWGQETARPSGGDVSFGQLWRQVGWAMYPLAAFSVATFALILYNALRVREDTLLRPDVAQRLSKALDQRDLREAHAVCESDPCIVSNITKAGLARVRLDDYDGVAVEKAMEEASVEEVAAPFVVISYLSIIALGGMGKPELLADNISEALITTAVGLIVGIPAMFAFFFFKSRYAKITSRLARRCGDLHHHLSLAMQRPVAAPRVLEAPPS
jgi:biopolymer transport protein ExbB